MFAFVINLSYISIVDKQVVYLPLDSILMYAIAFLLGGSSIYGTHYGVAKYFLWMQESIYGDYDKLVLRTVD